MQVSRLERLLRVSPSTEGEFAATLGSVGTAEKRERDPGACEVLGEGFWWWGDLQDTVQEPAGQCLHGYPRR